MKPLFKAFFTHFFVLVFFVVAALAYFSPVLQGKKIYQNDIKQYTGMAKEQNDFRKKTGEEPYWTNGAYGGMPTYQLGAYYPHDYVKKFDRLIRFLPRPADYLLLYFIGFYILLCCLKVDFRLAILGALAFGFSTYLIIIFGAGHNAKAHALAYLPMLLGGIVLTFRKKYLWGFVLTAIAMALEIGANHYQMTYYFMLLVLILGIVYLVDAIRRKELKHYGITIGILVLAVTLGIAVNATGLMATKEYADWSTRGKTELTIAPDGSPKENTQGLDKDYITNWSYGITESLNLFAPRLFGGGSVEDLGKDSKTYEYLTEQGVSRTQALELSESLPTYWGDQPGTSGPAYIGAIIFFLFILGMFLVKDKAKWWLLIGTLFTLMLSWGKNFSSLTNFMIDYFPLYDKFRAVSSIQVIVELCAPILAVLALAAIFNPKIESAKKTKSLFYALGITAGIGLLLLAFRGAFDFVGANDDFYRSRFGADLMDIIILDRKAMYTDDTLRSLLYVVLTAAVLWLFIKEKIKMNLAVLGLGLLIVFDLVGVDLRYVNKDDFQRARQIDEPFQPTMADKQILQDTDVYRVYDQSSGLESARSSYFHQSIGGYHAAKPGRMQELFDYHLAKGNFRVLDMLNVRYVIQRDQDGRSVPGVNPNAAGNAWFIKKLIEVTSADEAIKAIDSLQIKDEAVVNTSNFPNINRFNFQTDSTVSISLTEYEPNHLSYRSKNKNAGVAVFSEMYYAHGWSAYIDGVEKPHFRVNHTLRALRVPEGEHTIEFKFVPEIVQTGSKITLASSIVLALVVFGGIGFSFWRSRKKDKA